MKWRHILTALLLCALDSSLVAKEQSSAQTKGGDAQHPYAALERDIWTAARHELLDYEAKVVREIQMYPDDPYLYYLMSHLRLREFMHTPEDLALVKQASEMAQQAVDLAPRQDLGYVALAETLDLMGQSKRGVQLLETAAASGVDPTWRIYFTLARLKAETVDTEKLLGLLRQALGFRHSQPEIITPYIIAVLQTNYTNTDLIAALHAWDSDFPHTLFKQTIAITLANQGQHKHAHLIYQKIYQANPDYLEAKINDGVLLYTHLNRPRQAVKLFDAVLKSKTAYKLDTNQNALVHLHRGASYLHLKQIKAAKADFLKGLQNEEDQSEALAFITKSFRKAKQEKRLAGFIQYLTQEIKPSGILYALLGETQSETHADHRAALKSFSNAVLLEPHRSDFYNGMGLAFYRLKRHKEALKTFKTASKIDPNDATARYNQACMYSKLGETENALGTLQEALSLDPSLQQTAKDDLDFVNLRANPQFQRLISNQPPAPALQSVSH